MHQYIEQLQSYNVYQYTFLDDLSFVRSAHGYLKEKTADLEQISREEVIQSVRQRFLAAGWEGDGDIGVIWLPPFVDVGIEDTWGTYIWHVKQRNNGISFLLSPFVLNFGRLVVQNEGSYSKAESGTPVSIVQFDTNRMREAAQQCDKEILDALSALETLTDRSIADRVKEDFLAHKQGILVRTLQEFLDGCYLRFLIDAMHGNRGKFKIRKSRVQISPPSEWEEEFYDQGSFLTVQGVIGDMWRAYKYEPYKTKVEMLFKSVDFKLDLDRALFLSKHVYLRNCVQHHEGRLEWNSLQQLGIDEVRIKSADGDVSIERGKQIVFFPEELFQLSMALTHLAEEFDKHVWAHVPLRDHLDDDSD